MLQTELSSVQCFFMIVQLLAIFLMFDCFNALAYSSHVVMHRPRRAACSVHRPVAMLMTHGATTNRTKPHMSGRLDDLSMEQRERVLAHLLERLHVQAASVAAGPHGE